MLLFASLRLVSCGVTSRFARDDAVEMLCGGDALSTPRPPPVGTPTCCTSSLQVHPKPHEITPVGIGPLDVQPQPLQSTGDLVAENRQSALIFGTDQKFSICDDPGKAAPVTDLKLRTVSLLAAEGRMAHGDRRDRGLLVAMWDGRMLQDEVQSHRRLIDHFFEDDTVRLQS